MFMRLPRSCADVLSVAWSDSNQCPTGLNPGSGGAEPEAPDAAVVRLMNRPFVDYLLYNWLDGISGGCAVFEGERKPSAAGFGSAEHFAHIRC